MKRRLFSWTVVLAFLVVGLFPVASSVRAVASPASPAGQAGPGAMKGGGGEHPRMVAARRALENAKKQLEAAAHDYHGHRVKAIEFVDKAIQEIDEGIKSGK